MSIAHRLRIGFQARIGSGPSAQQFAQEFLAGIQRINYNQGNGLNALAGPCWCLLHGVLLFWSYFFGLPVFRLLLMVC